MSTADEGVWLEFNFIKEPSCVSDSSLAWEFAVIIQRGCSKNHWARKQNKPSLYGQGSKSVLLFVWKRENLKTKTKITEQPCLVTLPAAGPACTLHWPKCAPVHSLCRQTGSHRRMKAERHHNCVSSAIRMLGTQQPCYMYLVTDWCSVGLFLSKNEGQSGTTVNKFNRYSL